MAEEKKEPWLNYLALSTIIFAVCATLATLKGGGYSTKSVLSQARASDQWAFFQAKSIKENLYQLQSEKIQLEAKLDAGATAAKVEAYKEAIDSYNKKVEKYAKEKADIQKAAQDLETERDDAKRHSAPFGLAAIPLQIAILLSSIAALLKKRYLWLLALPVGLAGVMLFADGFLLFYAV